MSTPAAATYPVAPRVVAGLGALAALVGLGILWPLGFLQMGCTLAAGALALAAAPLVAFLGALALAPERLQIVLARRGSPIDLRDGGHVAAAVIMAGTLFFVLGWGGLLSAAVTVERCGAAGGDASAPIDGNAVLASVTLSLAVFTIPTILYLSFVHGVGPAGALRLVGLRNEGALRAALVGALAAIGVILVLALVTNALAPFVPEDTLANPTAIGIAKSVTLLGAIGLAAASALGEEVLFRGFLQPRIGLVATSLLFALAHFAYGSVSEVVAVLILAFAMGLLYQRTGNLWTTVATHFTFNLVNLVVAQNLAT